MQRITLGHMMCEVELWSEDSILVLLSPVDTPWRVLLRALVAGC